MNHNETLARDPAPPAAKVPAPTARKEESRTQLRVVKLEERIAPRRGGGCDEFGCGMNHNETLVRDAVQAGPKAQKVKSRRLRVTRLEGRIAPKIILNHNETLLRQPTSLAAAAGSESVCGEPW